jgi:glycogen operon protein
VHRFVRLLIAGRLLRDIALADPAMTLNQILGQARLEWHGVSLGKPDWGEDSHSLALTAWTLSRRVAFHLMINAWREPLAFELPPAGDPPGGRWRRWFDTSLPSPADIVPLEEAPEVGNGTYALPSHSVAVVFTRVLHAQSIGRVGEK